MSYRQKLLDSAVPGGSDSSVMGCRVLVAEDSSITQDLLKMVLTQRGHQVDLVNDGELALNALLHQSYDVALLDFHLPGLDGVQVAASYLAQSTDSLRPWFIAITADVEGLLAHEANCESFDKVVPKPVDIQLICRVVEDAGRQGPPPVPNRTTTRDKTVGGSKKRQHGTSAPTRSLSDDGTFVRWPADFDSKTLSGRALQATVQQGNIDALLVEEPATVNDLALIWQTPSLHLYPVLDMAGTLGAMADIDCSRIAASETGALADLIEGFHERRARLHRDALLTDDIGEKLLGRMFVANEPLMPAYDGLVRTMVRFNLVCDSETVINETNKLVEGGFLSTSFFDRVHVCASCGSSQLNVREECPSCRSSNLREEAYLHHFECAYQGPESDFKRGDDLICPKCRKELSYFGSDYDKPGTMVICGTCGHATSEPVVGFVCLSCGQHTDGDAMRTRDICSLDLTEKAIGFLEGGRAFLGFAQTSLRFADLPLDLVVALNDEARRFNQDGTPFALLDISYQNAYEIDREHGPRQLSRLRSLFLENLRNVLANDLATMVGEAKVVKGQAYDFALLKRTMPDVIRPQIELVASKATTSLRLDPGVAITVFAPEDLR